MRETTVVARLGDIQPGQMLYVNIAALPVALANVDGTI